VEVRVDVGQRLAVQTEVNVAFPAEADSAPIVNTGRPYPRCLVRCQLLAGRGVYAVIAEELTRLGPELQHRIKASDSPRTHCVGESGVELPLE